MLARHWPPRWPDGEIGILWEADPFIPAITESPKFRQEMKVNKWS
jgi:hypothetical protein